MRKRIRRSPIFTLVPDQPLIELVAYYDEFREYYPQCEMATKRWFVQNVREDWVIFDCGANIGYFSILFARLAPSGQVYAFEPTNTYQMLLANLAHHQIKNVMPLQLALGDKCGQIEDTLFQIWGHKPEKRVYTFTTIDQFVESHYLSRLNCIKIDVDSFDFEVLRGAERTLLKFNPFVMVELNHALSQRNQSVTQALEWLIGLGYEGGIVFDYDNFLFTRSNEFNKQKAGLPQIRIFFNQH